MDESRPVRRQRIIVRKCNAKLIVPSPHTIVTDCEVTFTCQLDKDHDGSHEEHGSVDMDNGTARTYSLYWDDVGMYASRKRKSRARLPEAA